MDLFGKALYDFSDLKKQSNFFLVDDLGNKFEQDLSWYFRGKIEDFDIIEKKLFEKSYGNNVLDIGSATGYYFKFLKSKNIKGIELSQDAINTAKKLGINNIEKIDIMNYEIKLKYDLIILMGNNLSIGGNINGTKKLIKILSNILDKDGKILSIFKKSEEKYFVGKFYCEYKDLKSDYFEWIRININFLTELLMEQNLKLKILEENEYGYCLEITKY